MRNSSRSSVDTTRNIKYYSLSKLILIGDYLFWLIWDAPLNLRLYSREEGTLGNGSTCIFDVYSGLVIWDGEYRYIDINAAETDPLVGMSLLYGYRIQLDEIEGGIVVIQSLNSRSSRLG
jgi:hypothetical protein